MRVILFLLSLLCPLPATAGCIVLLHGLARTDVSLAVMEQVFTARGYEVVNQPYPSTDQAIPILAEQTVPVAVDKCRRTPVHFVAHSMGNILIRYWFRIETPKALGHVVMLGPPNQGSELVDRLSAVEVFGLLNGPAGLQLGTGPEGWPRRLPPVTYPVGVVAGNYTLNPLFSSLIPGPDDGKVSVASTVVAGMRDHLVLPVTHTFMMNNPRVIAETMHFIEFGRFNAEISWLDAVLGTVETACGGRRECGEAPMGNPSR